MSTRQRIVGQAKDFKPCPEYEGPAVCVDVTEPKLYKSEFGDEMKFRFAFEVNEHDPDNDGQRFVVWSPPLKESLHQKAKLRAFLKSWFGRDLTPSELSKMDLETLVGRPAHLIVIHEQKDDTTYANIQLIRPARAGEILEPSGKFVRQYEREEKKEERAASASGSKFNRTSSSGAPPKPTSKTAPGAAEQDPGGVRVHIGKEKGIELVDLHQEKIEALIKNWLNRDFLKIAKPSADDKRLAVALKIYEAEYAAAAAGGSEPTEQEPETDY